MCYSVLIIVVQNAKKCKALGMIPRASED
jgi:hypothetical protein